jgi:hypothetical protein
MLVAVLAFATSSIAQGGRGNGHRHDRQVVLHASVSGSTLTVNLKGKANSRCALRLGSGKDSKALPRTGIGGNGRGVVKWDIPSDTSTDRQPLTAVCGHAGVRSAGRTHVSIPESAVSGPLATVLNILLDVILGGSLVLFLVLLINMVVREPDPGERLMRSLALICGALVALGAQAAGVDFASYTVEALTGTRAAGGAFKLLSIIVPGGMAAVFGWYFTQVMRRSAAMGLRLVSFLGMLTVIAFAAIFAEATSTQGVFLGAAAIPNTSFVIGLIFSVLVFNTPADDLGGSGRLSALTDLLRRPGGSARSSGAPPPESQTAKPTRSPFAGD